MHNPLNLGLANTWLALLAGGWLGWQLLRQNGRLLLRIDELEKRIDELESGEQENSDNGDDREHRFSNRSLDRSRIQRNGLKAGTVAPEFRLPRLDGRGDLALSDLRGRQVLLVFSSPQCGPCNALAPELEKFHREHPDLELVMISRGEPAENRARVRAHKLTFPVVLQRQWEISRQYAMFATPVAYHIDEAGLITNDVAVGGDAIMELLRKVEVSRSNRPSLSETIPA